MPKPKSPESDTIIQEHNGKRFRYDAMSLTSVFKYYGEPKPNTFPYRNLEDLFTKNKIRLTGPSEVNDPFDCNPRYISDVSGAKAIRNVLERRSESPIFSAFQAQIRSEFPTRKSRRRNKAFQSYLKQVTRTTLLDHYRNQGFASFTSVGNNPLMWAHYGSCHRGLMVEFRTRPDVDHGSSSELPIGSTLIRVRYTDDRPVIKESEFLKGMKGETWPESIVDAILDKPKCWEYENEWRYIGRVGKDRTEPVWQELHDIGRDAILSITIGSSASPETIEFAKSLASRRLGTRLYKNEISDRQFSFRTSPIEIS